MIAVERLRVPIKATRQKVFDGGLRITKKSMADFTDLARRVAAGLSPRSSLLEVAPGPGYFAIEVAIPGDYRVTGLDISQTFVEIARANAASAKVQAHFQRGDVSRMALDRERFDSVVCRTAFKNFTAPAAALRERMLMRAEEASKIPGLPVLFYLYTPNLAAEADRR
jgi:2-polyprenyl-3-methyl-5-hydroxy-6-metoxy-1,4-benzoquinol methylase